MHGLSTKPNLEYLPKTCCFGSCDTKGWFETYVNVRTLTVCSLIMPLFIRHSILSCIYIATYAVVFSIGILDVKIITY